MCLHIRIIGSNCSSYSILDVVFVIDTSGSIGASRFQLIREFTANITTELIRYSPRSSVGVILFSSNPHIQFNLQTYTNLSSLLSAINSLPYDNGPSTDTDEALTLLLSTAQNGTLGLRSDSKKVAIVITDGKSHNHTATLSAAAALHASNIFDVYAVGVNGADLTELQGIASSPDLVFFTRSFNSTGLQQLLQDSLIPQLCGGKLTITVFTYIIHIRNYYICIHMLNKNTLGVKKVRGQSEAICKQAGATKIFDIS